MDALALGWLAPGGQLEGTSNHDPSGADKYRQDPRTGGAHWHSTDATLGYRNLIARLGGQQGVPKPDDYLAVEL